jgi:predicted NBD/HSP70 family sugar kinase
VLVSTVRRGARPTDQADVRRHNAALVLDAIASGAAGPEALSRAQVAARTGLTRATVGAIVADLMDLGLVREGRTRSTGSVGRPGTDLGLDPDGAAGVGVEVNVDGITVLVSDLVGRVRHRATRPGDQRGRTPAAVLRSAARMVDAALDRADAEGLRVVGLGIAVPGLVDLGGGVLRLAPNLGWSDVAVLEVARRGARREWPARAVVDNEANLAALGELWASGPTSTRSFVLVNGEVGVGAGVVLDGRLHRGSRGFGGELGHLTVAPDGPPCRCGARGCLERMAGLDRILESAGLGPVRTGADAVAPLVERLREGDPVALASVAEAGAHLGIGAAALVNLFDVETVLLGGVFAPLHPWLGPAMSTALDERVLSARWAPVEVAVATLGRDAAAFGASRAAVRDVLTDPLG